MVNTAALQGDAAQIEQVVETLRGGELVLLPTETVYGLLSREEATDKLGAAKHRADQPFARLVADLGAVRRAGAALPLPARRLAERFWPGPLTLVLDTPEGAVGFRVPGHEFARRVVSEADFPVSATSANLSGQPPAATIEEALAAVGDHVTLAIDGGPSELSAPSTVVRVQADGRLDVLREGFLDRAAIDRVAVRVVLFVCTGNTCRSPMAEALFRERLASRLGVEPDRLADVGWEVASAGVAAGQGSPAAQNARRTVGERGLDLSQHASQPVSEELLDRAELVVALSGGHLRALADGFPEHAHKISLLDPDGVPDPIGGDLAVYRHTADHIASRLELLIDEGFVSSPGTQGAPAPTGPHDVSDLFPPPSQVPPAHDLHTYEQANTWLVGGEVRAWGGATVAVESVFCEPGPDGTLQRRVIGQAAALTGEAGLEALDAAAQAWDLGRGAWPTAPVSARLERLRRFTELMLEQRDEVVRLLMWEVGKSLAAARKEFDRTVEYIDATAQMLAELHHMGGRLQVTGGVLGQIRRAPLGVTLCMGPFNYPLNETYTTLIPALAMGNTAVVKLPKHGMLCNLPLLSALAEAFPPGVVNVVQGDGAELITPMITSGKVDVLAFIGSSRVARIIEKQHPEPYRLTTILGMDAKNPAVLLADADLDAAVPAVIKGALSFNGQRCTALKLIFVHRSIADAFAERLAAAAEGLRPGVMWTDAVDLTPLPELGKVASLTALVDDALAHGARVMNPSGGRTQGTFFFPAVIYPVGPESRLYQEEQFGPLVPIVPFDDVAEVHRYVAESAFGQQISVFGEDPQVLGPLVDSLANQVCRINLNRQCQRGPDVFPFTGRKRSAVGVLSVYDALEAFSIPAMVAASDTPDGRRLWERIAERGSSRFMDR